MIFTMATCKASSIYTLPVHYLRSTFYLSILGQGSSQVNHTLSLNTMNALMHSHSHTRRCGDEVESGCCVCLAKPPCFLHASQGFKLCAPWSGWFLPDSGCLYLWTRQSPPQREALIDSSNEDHDHLIHDYLILSCSPD